jgi:hypothetical protein
MTKLAHAEFLKGGNGGWVDGELRFVIDSPQFEPAFDPRLKNGGKDSSCQPENFTRKQGKLTEEEAWVQLTSLY